MSATSYSCLIQLYLCRFFFIFQDIKYVLAACKELKESEKLRQLLEVCNYCWCFSLSKNELGMKSVIFPLFDLYILSEHKHKLFSKLCPKGSEVNYNL